MGYSVSFLCSVTPGYTSLVTSDVLVLGLEILCYDRIRVRINVNVGISYLYYFGLNLGGSFIPMV